MYARVLKPQLARLLEEFTHGIREKDELTFSPMSQSCCIMFADCLIPESCVWRAFLIMAAYQGSPLWTELKISMSPQVYRLYNTST